MANRGGWSGVLTLQVLVLWGLADPALSDAIAHDIVQACSRRGMHCTLVRLPDAGHCPHDDSPETVNCELRQWLHLHFAKAGNARPPAAPAPGPASMDARGGRQGRS
jgi:hypothetical protein